MAKKSKKGARMEFYGSSELIRKIETLGGNIEGAVVKALKAGAKLPYEDMKSFAEQHIKTGDMAHSLTIGEPVIKNGSIKMKVGFVVKQGGLPAIFLNYGTPMISPTFFIDKAFEDNADAIKELQEEALKGVLREVE